MAVSNFADELAKLKKRRRTTEFHKRLAEGPRDPWRATRHGPMREIILTANKAWFEGFEETSMEDLFGESREARFENRALAWLKAHFGDDLVHARADLDETTFHIHAVILPRARTKDGRHVLQPSKHPMIADYEAAQDSVGAWFEEIGLVRGERGAEAIREAIAHNAQRRPDEPPKNVPSRRRHVSPRSWRRAQERKLAEQDREVTGREAWVATREEEADGILEIAQAVARGDLDAAPPDDKEAAPEAKGREDGSPRHETPRVAAARALFGKAFRRLKREADKRAQEALRREFDAVRTATDTLAEIASALPEKLRRRLEDAHGRLAAHLVKLRRLYRDGPESQSDRDQKE